MNRWGLLASFTAGAIVAAVGAAVWFIGLSPALFWAVWVLLATGTAVAVMWRPFMQFFHAKKRIRE